MSKRKDWECVADQLIAAHGEDGARFTIRALMQEIHWRGRAELRAALQWHLKGRYVRRVARGVYRGETLKESALRRRRAEIAIAKNLKRWERSIETAAYEKSVFRLAW